ncbi:hypothetical protein GCM10023321_73300 [Pseudonocardia eucalypti]|uniref:Uncharacterized protein n=1 Tax=Pseudonocardia eucalypti TaxID=648755 RepID=A0ABP9R865_9PSEU
MFTIAGIRMVSPSTASPSRVEVKITGLSRLASRRSPVVWLIQATMRAMVFPNAAADSPSMSAPASAPGTPNGSMNIVEPPAPASRVATNSPRRDR